MKTIVVYSSQYGTTRRYAEWIAQALGAGLVEVFRLEDGQLEGCGAVIFGGGLYAGGLSGARDFARHAPALAGKRLILFTVGLSDPGLKETTEKIRADLQKSLPAAILDRAQLFFLRGGIDYARLSFVHRMMMGMLAKILRKKPESERSESDRQLLATYGGAIDFTDRQSIAPIVAAARE